MLRLLLILLLIGAAPPPWAGEPAAGAAMLVPDAEARWVPFTLTPGNQIRFEMELDGRPVSAILDTGVSYSVLGRGSAAFDAARVRSGGSAAAIGGSVAIGWMATRRLALGGLVRTGGEVAVADLPALATGGAAPIDMLVGRDLTGGHALDIDYGARRFRLLASGRLPFRGQSAPLTISAERRVYESAVTLGARRLSPMIVDTGDGAALTVTQAGWRASGVAAATTSAVAYGLGGLVTNDLAVVPAATLGQVTADAVEVRIEGAAGFSQAVGVAGRIGSGFLQNYRVLLDPGAGRMVLSRRDDAVAAPARSTSGLLVVPARDRLRVVHVMRGSPAASTGWTAGEQICAVDGKAVGPGYAASPIAAWSAGQPGRTVSLTPCGGGAARRLTLSRFY